MGAITARVYYAFHKLLSLTKLVKPRKGPVRKMLPLFPLATGENDAQRS